MCESGGPIPTHPSIRDLFYVLFSKFCSLARLVFLEVSCLVHVPAFIVIWCRNRVGQYVVGSSCRGWLGGPCCVAQNHRLQLELTATTV